MLAVQAALTPTPALAAMPVVARTGSESAPAGALPMPATPSGGDSGADDGGTDARVGSGGATPLAQRVSALLIF